MGDEAFRELQSQVGRLASALEWQQMLALNLLSIGLAGAVGNDRLRKLFLEIVNRVGPTIACDIGANDGSAARAMKEASSTSVVHAFEANPEIHALHAQAMSSSGIGWHCAAIGAENRMATVYAPRTLSRAYVDGKFVEGQIHEAPDTGKTSLKRRNESAIYTEFEVPLRRLDDIFATELQDPMIRFALWIDVEGAADQVISGATGVLRHTDCVFIEVEGEDFWEDQTKADGIVSKLIGLGFIPIARDREYVDGQFNVLLLRTEAALRLSGGLFGQQTALRACLLAAPATGGGGLGARGMPARGGRPASLAEALQRRIPVLVPVFNTVSYARRMVEQLQDFGFSYIVLIDNASDYPGMAKFLDTVADQGVEVIRLAENLGPRDSVLNSRNLALLPKLFCVTDPDLEFNAAMPRDFVADLAALTVRYEIGKAGLALDIPDRNQVTDRKFQIAEQDYYVWEWEEQFWRDPVEPLPSGDPVYRAHIDTTFALYNRTFFSPATYYDAVRVGGRFTCRHLPWYRDNGLPEEEEAHYRQSQRFSYYLPRLGHRPSASVLPDSSPPPAPADMAADAAAPAREPIERAGGVSSGYRVVGGRCRSHHRPAREGPGGAR